MVKFWQRLSFSPRQIDKVHYIAEIKALPSAECRNAELALFSHRPQHAEAIYLQAGMVYKAIQLNTDLFNWERCVQYSQTKCRRANRSSKFPQFYVLSYL